MYKKQLRLNSQDTDIIAMALIDNAITGKLLARDKEKIWDIVEILSSSMLLYISELKLIYGALTRYAIRYHLENEKEECDRVAKYILSIVRGDE